MPFIPQESLLLLLPAVIPVFLAGLLLAMMCRSWLLLFSPAVLLLLPALLLFAASLKPTALQLMWLESSRRGQVHNLLHSAEFVRCRRFIRGGVG